VLVALRGEVRVLTIHLPPRPTEAEATLQMERIAAHMAAMGCDGWLWFRQIVVSGRSGREHALLVDECFAGSSGGERIRRQSVAFVQSSQAEPTYQRARVPDDAAAVALGRILSSASA